MNILQQLYYWKFTKTFFSQVFGIFILQHVIESSQVSHPQAILSLFISLNQLQKVCEKVIVSCQHSRSKLLIFVEKDTTSYQFSFPAASYWKLTTMSPGKLSVFVCYLQEGYWLWTFFHQHCQRKFPVFISHRKVIESSRQVSTRMQESCSTHQYSHFTKNTFSVWSVINQ